MGWHSGFEKTCICNTIRPLTTQYEDSLHQFESCTAHQIPPHSGWDFSFLLQQSPEALRLQGFSSPLRHTVIFFSHSMYSSANSDRARAGLQM